MSEDGAKWDADVVNNLFNRRAIIFVCRTMIYIAIYVDYSIHK